MPFLFLFKNSFWISRTQDWRRAYLLCRWKFPFLGFFLWFISLNSVAQFHVVDIEKKIGYIKQFWQRKIIYWNYVFDVSLFSVCDIDIRIHIIFQYDYFSLFILFWMGREEFLLEIPELTLGGLGSLLASEVSIPFSPSSAWKNVVNCQALVKTIQFVRDPQND